MADDIPEWAHRRATELVNKQKVISYPPAYMEAFARYISEHEEPPVDPVVALDEVIRLRFQWRNAGRVVAAELADRGFKIVEAQS